MVVPLFHMLREYLNAHSSSSIRNGWMVSLIAVFVCLCIGKNYAGSPACSLPSL